jgi:hypothetical protein
MSKVGALSETINQTVSGLIPRWAWASWLRADDLPPRNPRSEPAHVHGHACNCTADQLQVSQHSVVAHAVRQERFLLVPCAVGRNPPAELHHVAQVEPVVPVRQW